MEDQETFIEKISLPADGCMSSNQNLGPTILDGKFVRLEPVRPSQADQLYEAGRNLEWAWMLGPLRTKEAVDQRIDEGLRLEERDEAYAFAVFIKQEGRVVGSTAYLAINAKRKRAEIGSTWYSPSMWGTAVNPECKFLLLKHAFEDWAAVRVELGTDSNNVHSQHAILKLGTKLEGRLRNYRIRPDGTVGDTMLYSIIDKEWPDVKSKLLGRLKSFQ
jgi:RimJ/RimL family protein N-acetyltransferase